MAQPWTPALDVHETRTGCRLSLAGLTYGNGRTLQEAADDLVSRLLGIVLALRTSGLSFASECGVPDRRLLDFIWELGEISACGEDIRERVFGRYLLPPE
jgi:hypothetical protein